MKLRRRPRLQVRPLLQQFWHIGSFSSHLRWRSRHVRQPVRTRRDLVPGASAETAALLPLRAPFGAFKPDPGPGLSGGGTGLVDMAFLLPPDPEAPLNLCLFAGGTSTSG